MFRALENVFYRALDKQSAYSDTELHTYVLMFAAAVIACALHIFFTAFFSIAGCIQLALCHFGNLIVCYGCMLLLRRGYSDAAGITVSGMIIVSVLDTVYLIGTNNYVILYLLLVMMMLMAAPFKRKRMVMTSALLIPFLMIASYLFGLFHTPPFSIGSMNEALAVVNLFFCAVGVILLLSLERFVRNFLGRFHAQRVQELENQAYFDPLTQLYNRRYNDIYFARLKEQFEVSGQNICVAMADLDDFKFVNDTYGHEAGDLVLKTVSAVLSANVRKTDLVFRWGGEEFLMIIHDATPETAGILLDRIRETIAATVIDYEGQAIRATITIGIAKLDIANIQQSVELCDQKMYQGKHTGKNRVVI